MRRYHPDVNASADAVSNAKAINEAYACLRDKLTNREEAAVRPKFAI